MWEQTLIESKGSKKRKWWMFPLSFFLHALVIGLIVGMSYWMVEAVQAPPIPVTLYSAPPPPPPPPPAAGHKKEAPKPEPKPEKVEEPKEVQPTEIPEETEQTPVQSEELTPDTSAVDENATGPGEEGGVEGGVVGGVQGGVVGGVPGGVIGGTGQGGLGEEVPMRMTAEVKQPELIKKVEPPYPEVARRSRLEGVVVLEAVITKTGSVEEVKVLRSLHPVLDAAATNAVKQWKYKPAILNGRPVKVYFTVTVTFKLQ
jgi:periplasmic protein TonB